eukprot:Amastigsp_a147_2320.p3 type:complete len:195 gc:universal Amastigsp_a147_2320:832-248(-)
MRFLLSRPSRWSVRQSCVSLRPRPDSHDRCLCLRPSRRRAGSSLPSSKASRRRRKAEWSRTRPPANCGPVLATKPRRRTARGSSSTNRMPTRLLIRSRPRRTPSPSAKPSTRRKSSSILRVLAPSPPARSTRSMARSPRRPRSASSSRSRTSRPLATGALTRSSRASSRIRARQRSASSTPSSTRRRKTDSARL